MQNIYFRLTFKRIAKTSISFLLVLGLGACQTYEEQYLEQRKEIRQLKKEIEELQTEKRNLQQQVGKQEILIAENAELRQNNEELSSTMGELRSQIQNLDEQIEILTEYQKSTATLIATEAIEKGENEPSAESEATPKLTQQEDVKEKLVFSLKEELEKNQLSIAQIADRTVVRLDSQILFDSSDSKILPQGENLLKKLGESLKKLNNRHIQIEGHSDQRKISDKTKMKYHSNWELSTERALMVLHYFIDEINISPHRLSIASYGRYRPLVKKYNAQAWKKNRRVEFVLIPMTK